MTTLVAILLALSLPAAGRNTIASGSEDDDNDFFKTCPASRCAEGGPEIRFPFRLDSSPSLCGAPGMELSCSGNNDTVLALPHVGSFNVTAVDYLYGEITIDLGCSCLRCLTENQLTSLNLSTSVYQPSDSWGISLLECPRRWTPADEGYGFSIAGPISCLSSLSKFVYVADAYDYAGSLPSDCRVIADGLSMSFRRMAKSYSNWPTFKERVADLITHGEVTLMWNRTQITDKCMRCEEARRHCGFSSPANQAFCRHGPNIKLIAATSSAAFVILLLLVLILVYFCTRSKREKEIRLRVEKFLASYNAIKPTRYTFSELKKITKRFKNKLGQGGFGSVYKGELANGIPVAVKMLQRSKWDGREFTNEVATIGRIHHFNVVRLLGFCSEGTTHALIYEFMPNESLEKYIFSKSVRNTPHEPLTMEKLLEIAVGIARGIEYLHQGCNQRILHFDIKPHNILLDRNFNPKISDFGLAKLCSRDQSIVTMTAARGTMGYIAPEMYSRNFGAVSYKADVYSFGMLVLEMVGGRRNADPQIFENQSEFYFPEWIYDQLANGQDIGPVIEIANTSEIEIAKKLAVVGLWCVQWDPRDRPSMTRVVQMLIGDLENLQMPPTPFVSSSGQGVVITAPNEA